MHKYVFVLNDGDALPGCIYLGQWHVVIVVYTAYLH